MKKSFIQDLSVGLIILIASTILGLWINNNYQEPQIEVWDNGGLYGKIDGLPVGSIFLGNSGYKTDNNISVKIDDEIDEKDISIPSLSSNYSVKNFPDGTTVTINSLRPNENVQIFFTPKDKTIEYFQILGVLSEYNNIGELYYVGKWDINFELKIVLIFSLLLFFFLGWYLPKRINFYQNK